MVWADGVVIEVKSLCVIASAETSQVSRITAWMMVSCELSVGRIGFGVVPSHLAALQTGKNAEPVMPRRRLILGGEASRLEWIEQLRALAPECEIYNHYGPTETTVGVLTYRVTGQLPATRSGTAPSGTRTAPGT